MPERSYRVFLDEDNAIFIYFETIGGEVAAFVVKHLTMIGDEEYEVVRFDSGHEVPHMDILHPDGTVKDKIWFRHLDNAQAFTQAKENIKQHYRFYRERFIQWKTEIK